ncbi:MAG: hypothetical protein KTR31_27900 [Myxococcales bacterium]|nr:hypothetical protein [Myxococcales bacterium]
MAHRRSPRTRLSWWLLLLALASSSCATRLGARSLPTVRAHYNEAVAQSSSEQMLLNLVRLRYAHTVQFLEPVSVVTTYSYSRNAGASAGANLNGEGAFSPIASGGLSAGIAVTETPTITYSPLSGEEFVRRLAAPLPPELVMLLVQGGWPFDLVFPVVVAQVGPARAPVIAAAAEPSDFTRIVGLLSELQRTGALQVELGGAEGPVLGLTDRDSEDAAELRRLLQLGDAPPPYVVGGHTVTPRPDEISIVTRSMMNTLFYLSHGVHTPTDDARARDLGVELPVRQPLIAVHHGEQPPDHAYVSVPYLDRWFWIDDTDLASKRTFGMLTTVFSLMSAPTEAATPVLTLPR